MPERLLALQPGEIVNEEPVVSSDTFFEYLLPNMETPRARQFASHLNLPPLKPLIEDLYACNIDNYALPSNTRETLLYQADVSGISDPAVREHILEMQKERHNFANRRGQIEVGRVMYYDMAEDGIAGTDIIYGTYDQIPYNTGELIAQGKIPLLIKHRHPHPFNLFSPADYRPMILAYDGTEIRTAKALMLLEPATDRYPPAQILALASAETMAPMNNVQVANFVNGWNNDFETGINGVSKGHEVLYDASRKRWESNMERQVSALEAFIAERKNGNGELSPEDAAYASAEHARLEDLNGKSEKVFESDGYKKTVQKYFNELARVNNGLNIQLARTVNPMLYISFNMGEDFYAFSA